MPTLAIHGARDPLISPAGSVDITRHVDAAELTIIDGMGHDLPPDLY